MIRAKGAEFGLAVTILLLEWSVIIKINSLL